MDVVFVFLCTRSTRRRNIESIESSSIALSTVCYNYLNLLWIKESIFNGMVTREIPMYFRFILINSCFWY